MDFDGFVKALPTGEMPVGLNTAMRALWHDAAGDWDTAHEIVQQLNDAGAARIHAYLHRKEGDHWNARYWHRQAGSIYPEHMSLEQEWASLVASFVD